MKKAAVLGSPISHSLSPFIHNYWLKEYGINGSYEMRSVSQTGLGDELKKLVDEGFAGVNLTIPLKQKVIPYIHVMDETAKAIGAVNTLVFADGVMQGFNTDAYGFMENLKSVIGNISTLKNGRVVILGAGGAARAIVYALKKEGFSNIGVYNRSEKTAKILAHDFDINIYRKIPEGIDFLVQTTPLGMKGQQPLSFDLSHMAEGAVIYDIVYNPLMTELLISSDKAGARTVTGLGMLLYQAVPAFEKFFGIRPEVTDTLKNACITQLD